MTDRIDLDSTQKLIDGLFDEGSIGGAQMRRLTKVVDEARKLERITKRLEEVAAISETEVDVVSDTDKFISTLTRRLLAQELLKELNG